MAVKFLMIGSGPSNGPAAPDRPSFTDRPRGEAHPPPADVGSSRSGTSRAEKTRASLRRLQFEKKAEAAAKKNELSDITNAQNTGTLLTHALGFHELHHACVPCVY